MKVSSIDALLNSAGRLVVLQVGDRVRHLTAGSVGTVAFGPIVSRSPWNPGTWVEVECEADGFVFWCPIDMVELVAS